MPRGPVLFVLGVVVIDAMGLGLIMPVMPDLLREVLDSSLARAALWGGLLAASFAVMQFLCAPTLGGLSDRFGRRPVLLVSLAVMAAGYLAMGLAGSIGLLLAARVVAGIASATQAVASAFIADTTPETERAAGFGLVGAAFGIGIVLGPALGGLLGSLGPRAPFHAAALLTALAFVAGWLVMPESLTAKTRRRFRLSRANPLGALMDLGKLPGLGRLFAFHFFYTSAFMVYPAVWAYFAAARFHWSPPMIGLSLALYGIAHAVVLAGLVRPALRMLGERGTVLWGLALNVASLLVIGSLTSGTLALALTPLAALGGVVTPAVQGMMSRRAGARRQGSLQGVAASIRGLAAIVSPVAMTAVFAWFTYDDKGLYLPGAPFYFAALLALVCIVILARTPRAER